MIQKHAPANPMAKRVVATRLLELVNEQLVVLRDSARETFQKAFEQTTNGDCGVPALSMEPSYEQYEMPYIAPPVVHHPQSQDVSNTLYDQSTLNRTTNRLDISPNDQSVYQSSEYGHGATGTYGGVRGSTASMYRQRFNPMASSVHYPVHSGNYETISNGQGC